MLNAAQTVNLIAAVLFASTEDQAFDLYLEPDLLGVYAASDNIAFDVVNDEADAEAASVQGVREIKIAEFVGGTALADSFKTLTKLVQGTNAPRPAAVTSETTYHSGTVATVRTGVNNGATEWTIEGSSDSPEIALLVDYSPIEKENPSGKEGKSFAYEAFNVDRSCFYGRAIVTSAYSPDDGAGRWTFALSFVTSKFRGSSQNPAAGAGNVPQAADVSPDSGPVGTTVTVRGVNMDTVASIRLGATDVGALTGQTPTQVSFTVPAGATEGPKSVVGVYNTDDEAVFGVFTVTAA